jgi:hypothetical protein
MCANTENWEMSKRHPGTVLDERREGPSIMRLVLREKRDTTHSNCFQTARARMYILAM